MFEIFLALILIFMIVAALVAIFTEELLSAVIAAGAVGFGASMAFLFMRAPDLAITQIAVEVVSLVLLIKVTIRVGLRLTSGCCKRLRFGICGFFVLLIFAGFIFLLRDFPSFGVPVTERIAQSPSVFYIKNSLELTGSANLVTAVLLDFRAYDTLGEATVILTAVLGGIILLRKNGKKKSPFFQQNKELK